jgi:hypothetical protein
VKNNYGIPQEPTVQLSLFLLMLLKKICKKHMLLVMGCRKFITNWFVGNFCPYSDRHARVLWTKITIKERKSSEICMIKHQDDNFKLRKKSVK